MLKKPFLFLLLFIIFSSSLRAATISGTITDQYGNPVSNAYLYASAPSWESSYSSITGTYTISNLEPGKYSVYCYAPNGSDLCDEHYYNINVTSGQITTFDITLQLGGIITGKITDEYGNPVSNAYVYASGPSWESSYSSVNGSYTIRGLKQGVYFVKCQAPNGSDLCDQGYYNINVTSEKITTINITLQVGGTITGKITDEYGNPVYFAYIYASGLSDESSYSSANGSYTIRGLKQGVYFVYCQAPNGHQDYYNINVTNRQITTLNITLLLGGTIITGKITDEYGNPVPDAYIHASGPSDESTYSSINGIYTIRGLTEGIYCVSCYPQNDSNLISANYSNIEVQTGQRTVLNITLHSGRTITGKVTDEYGNPVYNAYVYASGPKYEGSYSSLNGSYTITGLNEGQYVVYCDAPNNSDLTDKQYNIYISREQTRNLDIILEAGATITGKVVDSNNNPVYKTSVYISYPIKQTYTSENGTYTLKNIAQGVYTINFWPPSDSGLVGNQEKDISLLNHKTRSLDVVLQIGGIINGKTTDLNGNIVANTKIRIQGAVWKEVYSSNSGTYTITGLPSGMYGIFCIAPDDSNFINPDSKNLFISTGDIISADFNLKTGSIIRGRVSDENNNPVPNVTIYCNSKSTVSSETGIFTVKGLSVGQQNIYFRTPDDSEFLDFSLTETLTSENDEIYLNIQLEKGGKIAGKIVDTDGNALAGVIVNNTKSDSGRYELNKLRENNYNVYFEKQGYLSRLEKNIGVTAGQTTRLDVVFSLQSIKGRIMDYSGLPCKDTYINVQLKDSNRYGYSYPDAQGYYSLKGIEPGFYYLSVKSSKYKVCRSTLVVQDNNNIILNDIILQPEFGVLEGQLYKSDGITAESNESYIFYYPGGTRFDNYESFFSTTSLYYSYYMSFLDDYSHSQSIPVPANSISDISGRFKNERFYSGNNDVYVTRDNKVVSAKYGLNLVEGTITSVDFIEKDGDFTVSGKIANIQGTGTSAYVWACYSSNKKLAGFSQTDTDGKYTIKGLTNGEYEVYACMDEKVTSRIGKVRVAGNVGNVDLTAGIANIESSTSPVNVILDNITLQIPENCFDEGTQVYVSANPQSTEVQNADLTIPLGRFIQPEGSYGWELKAIDSYWEEVQPKKEITMVCRYPANINGLVENNLRVYILNNNTWKLLQGEQAVDIQNNTITAKAAHFTNLSILIKDDSNKSLNVKVYPNPFKANNSSYIRFEGLTYKAELKIFNVNGELITTLNKNDPLNYLEWDAKNLSGEQLASGVYIYLITNLQGEKKTGKAAIIR